MVKPSLTITPEADVPTPAARRPGRQKDERKQALVNEFLAMAVGNSFFVEGAKRRDLEFFRKPVKALGGDIEIYEVTKDEIYGVAGTRCWRRTGLIDLL